MPHRTVLVAQLALVVRGHQMGQAHVQIAQLVLIRLMVHPFVRTVREVGEYQ